MNNPTGPDTGPSPETGHLTLSELIHDGLHPIRGRGDSYRAA